MKEGDFEIGEPASTARPDRRESQAGSSVLYRTSLLVALRLVTVQAIDHRRLRTTKCEPVLHIALERYVELGRQLFLLLGDRRPVGEFQLEGELAHQRLVLAARPPQTNVALGHQALTEVELSQRQQHLFDDTAVDQLHPLFAGSLQFGQRRENLHQGCHRRRIAFVYLARTELAVVRIQNAIAAYRVLQRQRLRLELNTIFTGDLRPDVYGGRCSLVGMAVFKDDLRISNGKTVEVSDAAPKDERALVQAEVGGVHKNNLAHLWPQAGFAVFHKTHAYPFRRLLHQFAELPEAIDRNKAVGFQDQLGFQVGDLIERSAVRVDPCRCRRRLGFGHCTLTLFLFFFYFCFLFFLLFNVLAHVYLRNSVVKNFGSICGWSGRTDYVPAMPLFCSTRTTTRRFSAWPSAVLSLPTWRLSPMAPGASMLVIGMWPCCTIMFATLLARSSLNF